MASLEDLQVGAVVDGLAAVGPVTVVSVRMNGTSAATVVFRDEATGTVDQKLVYRSDEHKLSVVEAGRHWAFDGDGELFRLTSEAHRIRLAYLFDPLLAVHVSSVEPLPHQIAAVYEEMLRRQPLRYLLADDPGAGKTIMAGLFIKELILRGDLQRCLIVCPANLAEQWQDEMLDKFRLNFEIIQRNEIEASATGNPFNDRDLVISRIDLLKQDDNMERLAAVEWDLVIVDEAHKMSARYFGGEIKRTGRYRLGEALGKTTRHLLLMTATPHSGKDEDFQLFMALLDADRFEGKFRDGVHQSDPSDMMRRALKEELVDFEGHKLFPDRRAYTVNYELSDAEATLYEAVTRYVTDEMNRADDRVAEEGGERRRTVVGFALTILQRRLASSPAAIHESLKRRLKKLQQRLQEAKQARRAAAADMTLDVGVPIPKQIDIEDLEDDLEEDPESEASEIVDLATAARTISELETEVESLKRLESLAASVRSSGHDRKWDELSRVLEYREMYEGSVRRKVVIFTEHKDTLDYLVEKIGTALGRPESVVAIHGSLGREARRNAQEKFLNDPEAKVLVATDAAGEGVNLQRAHLMVNYDLPWNPNRIEQRFGRIHRFGQKEVCHLWNLVAHQTREGAVYQRLFEKLEEERKALGGKVFDVLGRAFTEVALRDLMIDAIRYNTSEEATAWVRQKIDSTWTPEFLRDLVAKYALNSTTINATHLRQIREDMERAEARRLVPHFIESFFVEGFKQLGGSISQREPRRYQISFVPHELRRRDRTLGRSAPIQQRYERICFDKNDRDVDGKPPATFVAPGHPLLDTTADVLLSRHRELLRRGCVLVDESDVEGEPRVMFSIESEVTDGHLTREGNRRVVSRQVDYVEVGQDGSAIGAGSAPYLDYRALRPDEMTAANAVLDAGWVSPKLEETAELYAIETVVQEHYAKVRRQRDELVAKTIAAVRERLTKEIQYWDHRAEELKLQELAGKTPRINSGNARRRCDELEARLEKRMRELEAEHDMSASPPVITGGCLVIPAQVLAATTNGRPMTPPRATKEIEKVAMDAIMAREREAGRTPKDVSRDNRGWDIESADESGRLRFIEVKGRRPDADTVCVSRNEWLAAMNKGDAFELAIVVVDQGSVRDVHVISDLPRRDRDFVTTSMNLDIRKLVAESAGA